MKLIRHPRKIFSNDLIKFGAPIEASHQNSNLIDRIQLRQPWKIAYSETGQRLGMP
jgi:hypothetical protein